MSRPITASRGVTFGAACRGCPLRAQCTTARAGRHLTVSQHEQLMRNARRYAETDAFTQPYRQQRPMVERSIAWLVRGTTASSDTAESPRTTSGSTTEWPDSTCAGCSCWA